MTEIPKAYEPAETEKKWYPIWKERRYFHADDKSDKPPFAIVIPPPNVTGALHMGHAFTLSLQDILTRFRRMQGYNTCWLPGTDHAGIATQNVVEKALAKEGTDRHQLGREGFIKRVWEWKEQYGERIVHQLERLGASCDWERMRFTMDEGLSRAVREVFVHLFNEGLIYRDKYLINWCPRCHTAISDIEVEHEEVNGHLWHIRYPLADGSGELVVATTRPETMLGDTAVAVHPDDERYAAFVGKKVRLPLVGREVVVLADRRVDREFGTGAVKVTPAHDPNDFQLGNDHELERINIFNESALVNEAGGQFAGLDRFAARKAVVEALTQEGLLTQTDDHRHNVGHCYRCKTIIEPYLSLQWFVKAEPLAKKAHRAVKIGQTKFFPKHWTQVYADWMDRIQPWCISRQIWWGHRIPAWYCANYTEGRRTKDDGRCGPIVAREAPAKCPTCNSAELRQDPDVLDTWFSSALWPFSTFGWPDQTTALKSFYPTSVLVTGHDIIFFWVARMMMMGIRFMGDIPFKDVYIHALVRDPLGQKMSKSKGNVIDPLEMMDRYGTDAFRFTLAAMAAQGRDVRLSEERISSNRNFCNKLWNAARFIAMQFDGVTIDPDEAPDKKDLSLADRWILFRYHTTVNAVTKALEAYEFDVASRVLYQFVWHEFCDWYLEAAKAQLQGTLGSTHSQQPVLHTIWTVFEGTLRLLHPMMPFITEELWQQMQAMLHIEELQEEAEAGDDTDTVAAPVMSRRSIVVAPWPDTKKRPVHSKDIRNFEKLMELITAIRMLRSQHRVPPGSHVTAIIRTKDNAMQRMLGVHSGYLRALAKLQRFELRVTDVKAPGTAVAVVGDIEVGVPLADIIDLDGERTRLTREIERAQTVITDLEQRLGNAQFVDRAPADIVKADQSRLEVSRSELSKLKQAAHSLQ